MTTTPEGKKTTDDNSLEESEVFRDIKRMMTVFAKLAAECLTMGPLVDHLIARESQKGVSFAGKTPRDVRAAVRETQNQFIAGKLSAGETTARVLAMRQWLKDTPLAPTTKKTLTAAVDRLKKLAG